MKIILIWCSLIIFCHANKNKWTDPSLNTPENNEKVLEEVKQGLHKHHHEDDNEHDHHEHDHHHHDHDHHEHDHHHHDHDHHEHDHDEHGHHTHDHHEHGHHTHDHHEHGQHEHDHDEHGHHTHDHHEHGHHTHDHHEHGQHEHDHHHGEHDNTHDHHEHSHTHDHKEKASDIWLKAFTATALISLAPFLILYLIPIDRRNEAQENFLKVLLAFASGGLLGDAFLHLIPHAISPHSHDGSDHSHSHDHAHDHAHDHHGHSHGNEMAVGMWTLCGILTFLLIEKFVIAIKGGHSHSHGPIEEKIESTEEKETKEKETSEEEKKDESSEDEKSETEEKDCAEEPHQEVKVSAYLNMAADMTHNFTDGLAIGSSFLVSDKMGYMTTFLILVHEVPHEIGDFAILVQSGFTKRKAMHFQLLTALGALFGTACGLVAESFFASASQFILPFTAGGFIYIATVTVIPELLEGASSLWQGVKEIAAMSIGIGLMVLIAEYE